MQKNTSAYLMAHFTGEETESGEQVYFSVSLDGLHWKDLNQGKPVLTSTVGEQGARDPFLLRSHNNKKFYIIATDARIFPNRSWTDAATIGSRSLLVWESEDLIDWGKEKRIEVGIPEAGCVWAPEAIYDKEKESYLVFWASNVKESEETEAKQRIYCSYTNDFHTFSPAKKYIERENHVIDTTIIYAEGKYYRFSKDETTKNIYCDSSISLSGPFKKVNFPNLEAIYGVEGPACVYLSEQKEWCLMVDRFATNKGYLPLLCPNLETMDFRVLSDNAFDLGKGKKRHGSLLAISQEEYHLLVNTYKII